MQRYKLLCEGQCNSPSAQVLARRLARQSGKAKCLFQQERPCAVAGLPEAIRALVYTTHVLRGPDRAACTQCGVERQYGGNHVH